MALLSGLMRKADAEPAANGDVVKDSDTQNFMKDVIEASRSQPVIVDFWAPWCGPCKQLGPIIERVVRAAGGKVRLVKINIDESPELAQQLRIQSIPMVYGFVQGQPVDGFAGALPESQIKAFVERLAGPVGPSPVEAALEQAKGAVAAGQMDVARQLYERVLGAEPENPEALAGAARCQIATGRLAAAREILDSVPTQHANHVEIDGARAALSLAEEAGTLAGPERLARAAAGRSGRSRRAPRPRHEPVPARPGRGCDRRAADHRAQGPRMAGPGGAQAADQVLRGARPQPSGDGCRPPQAVRGAVLLRPGRREPLT